jgi:imidazolonepropionase-like amidohydrolase
MSERIHLVGGRVLTCTGDRTEVPRPAEVLIEGERIVAVASDPLPVDPGTARRIDLRGATVLPGLGDAHVHLSWPLDFVFDHAAVAAEDPARHALDLAGVARSFLESGYTFVIGAGVLQERDDLHLDAAIRRAPSPAPASSPAGRWSPRRAASAARRAASWRWPPTPGRCATSWPASATSG